jgi:hypothetical protein
MTCVWDALHARMDAAERALLGVHPQYSPERLLTGIKAMAPRCMHAQPVRVNGEPLSDQFLREGVARIMEVTEVRNGYDMSGCDPLLVLVCAMFSWHIKHTYAGALIEYAPERAVRQVQFGSSHSHFY